MHTRDVVQPFDNWCRDHAAEWMAPRVNARLARYINSHASRAVIASAELDIRRLFGDAERVGELDPREVPPRILLAASQDDVGRYVLLCSVTEAPEGVVAARRRATG